MTIAESLQMIREMLEGCEECEKDGTSVQSVLCLKSHFKSVDAARKWVLSHKFKASKVDVSETAYRFRQFSPDECKAGSFRNIVLTEGVQAIICKR